jgi:predicted permease
MGLRNWFRRTPSDEEIRSELEIHVAMRAERDGTDESAARKRLGNFLQTQEAMRGVWHPEFWGTVVQDARFILRTWLRSPGFAVPAFLAIALGLGAATGLFSMVDRILFRSLPYPDSDRLVSVGLKAPLDANEFMLGPDYLELWRETPSPFESVTTITAGSATCDLTEARPERLSCAAVESNLLQVLGLQVAAGRDFRREDERPGGMRVALITYGLWLRRFGGDPRIQGRQLVLDGEPVEVAGVLPRDFELPTLGAVDVLLPQQLTAPVAGRPAPMVVLRAFARLTPGVTPVQASAALQPLFAAMLKNVPSAFRSEVTLRVRSLRDRQTGDSRRTAWLLLVAVGALVLIVCTNVTNLLLARMAARERELAVRASLGATRSRLMRLVLTESLLLAAVGTAAGLFVAYALLKVSVALAPTGIPRLAQASLDVRVLVAAGGLAIICTVLIGISPALSIDRCGSLHGSRTITVIRPLARFALVSMQMALTLALLGTSTLLLRSLWNLQRVSLGFEAESVLTASLTLSPGKYRSPERQIAFFEQLLERVQRIPGIQTAALSDSLPPYGAARSMIFSRIEVEGRPLPGQGTGGMVTWRSVTPGYFETLRIPILRGRPFTDQDRHIGEPALILSEQLERRLFPSESALGKRLKPGTEGPWHIVVGIARDIRNAGPTTHSEPEYYVARRPLTHDAQRRSFLIVRTQAAPTAVTALLRAEIADLDSQLPVTIQTMSERVGEMAARPRFTAWLLIAFAGLALVLASTGLAGIATFLVAQRTRDFGVRIALGATPDRIRSAVLREAGAWVAAGTILGLALSWAFVRFLGSFLHGVTAWDPLTWTVSLLVLSGTLVVSVLPPAGRAARIDPMIALRSE